jgi:uncharacterized phage protein (TIGR02218 family)
MKSIPISLQSHYDQDATTTCLVTRILTKSGDLYGFTDLDADIIYNPATVDPGNTGDDWGSATHSSLQGFTPSRWQKSADTAVDNAELSGVIIPGGISLAQIRAGLFQGATIRVYRVNYMDLTQGHDLVDYGRLGETRLSRSMFSTEFRSLMGLTKQPISVQYSTDCRAHFGSKAIGTGDGSFEERHPCGKDFVWDDGVVTSLGSNARRIFIASALTATGDFYSPGVVRFTSGANAGFEMEVDDYNGDTKTITLALALPYTIAADDEFEIRQDCSKLWDDDQHGCLYHYGSDRVYHFQGEPHIPVADGGSNMVPGAQITRR